MIHARRNKIGATLLVLLSTISISARAEDLHAQDCYDHVPPSPEQTRRNLTGLSLNDNEAVYYWQRVVAFYSAYPVAHRPIWDLNIAMFCLAPLLFLDGKVEEAKKIATDAIPLVDELITEETKQVKASSDPGKLGPLNGLKETKQMFQSLLNGDKKAVKDFAQRHVIKDETVGALLEGAYGQVWICKNNAHWFERLPWAYDYLGKIQTIAGDYREAERAFKASLGLAEHQYATRYPAVIDDIRSDYATMLSLSGKKIEADKVSKKIRHLTGTTIYGNPPTWYPSLCNLNLLEGIAKGH